MLSLSKRVKINVYKPPIRNAKRNISFYRVTNSESRMLEAHEYDDIKEWQEKLVGVAPPFLKDSIQNSIYDAALQSRINLPSEAVGIYFSKIRNRSNHVDFHLQDWPEEVILKFNSNKIIIIINSEIYH